MQAKSFDEWVKVYEEKTGDKYTQPPEGFSLMYLPERGFADMKINTEGKMVFVNQVCGDAKFWRDLAEIIANAWHCNAVCTVCTRHILPYIRSFGWEVVKEFSNIGVGCEKRYLCQDSIGRKIVITHQGFNAKGEPQYWVTQYINEKISLDDDEIDKLAEYGKTKEVKNNA